MLKIIIYALGTGGDIDPMIGVGIELQRRGFAISFLSNDYFKSRILAAGFEFVSVGTLEQYHKGNSAAAWESRNHTDNFEHYHVPAFEPAFEYVKSLAGTNTLLLALGEENGAAAAAEKFNIPFVKLILSPNIIFSAYNPPAPMKWAIPSTIPRFIVRFLLRKNRKTRFKVFAECHIPLNIGLHVNDCNALSNFRPNLKPYCKLVFSRSGLVCVPRIGQRI